MASRKTPEQWEAALNRWTRTLGDYSAKSLTEASERIAARARWYAPHDTGRLASKIEAIKVTRKDFLIKGGARARAKIAHLLEFGTVKMAPRPYMRPAANEELGDLEKALADAVGDSAAKAEAGDKVGSGRFSRAPRGRVAV